MAKLRGEASAADTSEAMPSYGPSVTVTSSSQKLQAKLDRKDKRRQGKAGAGPIEGERSQGAWYAICTVNSTSTHTWQAAAVASWTRLEMMMG